MKKGLVNSEQKSPILFKIQENERALSLSQSRTFENQLSLTKEHRRICTNLVKSFGSTTENEILLINISDDRFLSGFCSFKVAGEVNSLGYGKENSLRLSKALGVKKSHAILEFYEEKYYLTSVNRSRIFVNGEKIEKRELKNGCR